MDFLFASARLEIPRTYEKMARKTMENNDFQPPLGYYAVFAKSVISFPKKTNVLRCPVLNHFDFFRDIYMRAECVYFQISKGIYRIPLQARLGGQS